MTIDELLELPAEELEKLTDEQLMEFFKPKLQATRPLVRNELKVKERKPKKRKASSSEEVMQRLMNMAERAEKLEKLEKLEKMKGGE